MKEIWRDIIGYEGLYQISNLGNIKSLNYNSTGEKKLLSMNKLCNIELWQNKKSKRYMINRLVAQAFLRLDVTDNDILVRVRDKDMFNHNVNNLYLETRAEMHQYTVRNGNTNRQRYIKNKLKDNPSDIGYYDNYDDEDGFYKF